MLFLRPSAAEAIVSVLPSTTIVAPAIINHRVFLAGVWWVDRRGGSLGGEASIILENIK